MLQRKWSPRDDATMTSSSFMGLVGFAFAARTRAVQALQRVVLEAGAHAAPARPHVSAPASRTRRWASGGESSLRSAPRDIAMEASGTPGSGAALERGQAAAEWEQIRVQFLSEPGPAIQAADQLVGQLLGLPTPRDGSSARARTHLSAKDARPLHDESDLLICYHAAQGVVAAFARGHASIQDLYRAMGWYNTVCAELLGPSPRRQAPSQERSIEAPVPA